MKLQLTSDGAKKLRKLRVPRVREREAEIRARYEGEFKQVGPWRRFWLRRRMEAEIEECRRGMPSPDSLY